jgi:phosphopantothenoylcysteine decarboxylase/phosphopantothenate--cysteine ligase
MKILVTAGPTREPIDAVRFISNASSGRMGYAVAAAAVGRGHDVDLVTGPTDLPLPKDVNVTKVMTALQMRDAVLEMVSGANALVMTAAVSDWRFSKSYPDKIEKGREPFSVELVPNPDILSEATGKNPDMLAVAFALEVGMDTKSALEKMRRKGADFVVLNSLEAMGALEADFAVYSGPGDPVIFGRYTKQALAEALLALVEEEKSS